MKIVIAGMPIRILSNHAGFEDQLRLQYSNFMVPDDADCASDRCVELSIDLAPPSRICEDEDLHVRCDAGSWLMQRGDFSASYDPVSRRGTVRQSANRYSIDSVIRIVQSLELAGDCGFLLHASSAIRAGRGFIFSGVSGAGKTTMARLAPPGVQVLTDEVSCVRKCGAGFHAWGTPFAGELARPGENVSAPVGALYFLEQAAENRVTLLPPAEALRLLMKNVLFFANDPGLVRRVFEIAQEFLGAADAFRLAFQPDRRVWDLIG